MRNRINLSSKAVTAVMDIKLSTVTGLKMRRGEIALLLLLLEKFGIVISYLPLVHLSFLF